MDKQFLEMILNIVIVLPFIIFLIYLSLKYGSTKLQNIQNGRFIKVLERVSVTKDSALLLLKIGDKVYVASCGSGKTEMIMELTEEEAEKLEDAKNVPEYEKLKQLLTKLKIKGKDKDE